MVAKLLNLKVGKFIHVFGDCHIYLNHLDEVKTQLKRKPFPLPTLKIKSKHQKTLSDFKLDDFVVKNYLFHDKIVGKIVV
jgi:thymidylate synthase